MYTPSQHRLIARELARAGGHVEKALEVLRLGYDTLDSLSEGTIRNLLLKREFRTMVRDQEKLLSRAQRQGDFEAERVRAHSEAFGKEKLRFIAADIITTLHKRICKEPNNLEVMDMLRKYIDLHQLLDGKKPEGGVRPEDIEVTG